MPLISHHLTFVPEGLKRSNDYTEEEGLAAHSDNVTKCVARSYKEKSYTDLIFVCKTGVIHCHQAMLESLSPKLRETFQAHNCCNCSGSSCGRRETIQIHIPDVTRDVLRSVLELVYTGKSLLSTSSRVKEVEEVLKMLDLKLPGNLHQEKLGGGQVSESELVVDIDTPATSSCSSSVKDRGKTKRKRSDTSEQVAQTPSKVAKLEKSPDILLLEMAKMLMPLSENKCLPCNSPGCDVIISHANMTKHFEGHFAEHEKKPIPLKPKAGVILFKCDKCGKGFKFRKALENHVKNCKSRMSPRKTQIVLSKRASFSSDSLESSISEKIINCSVCKKNVPSAWHLHPSRHSCVEKENIEQDVDDPKPIASPIKESPKHQRETSTVSNKNKQDESKVGKHKRCPKCNELFVSSWNMRCHLSAIHFKKEILEANPGMICSICRKDYSSKTEMLKHIGGTHKEVLEKILNKEGLSLDSSVSPKKVVDKVSNGFKCPKCGEDFDKRSTMKIHVANRHYMEKLTTTYPGTQCTICDKELQSRKMLLKHIAIGHEKILVFLLGKEGLILPPKQDQVLQSAILKMKPKQDKVLESAVLKTEPKYGSSEGKKQEEPKLISGGNNTPEKKLQEKKEYGFKCPKCDKICQNYSKLKVHIGVSHYYKKLSSVHPGTKCERCNKESSSHRNLVQHILMKHDKVLVWLLGRDGLYLPSKTGEEPKQISPSKNKETENDIAKPRANKNHESDTSSKIHFGANCQICSQDISHSTLVAMRHYLKNHFKDKLKADSEGLEEYQCFVCKEKVDKSLKNHSKSLSYFAHLRKHPEILVKYLKVENLYEEPSPSYSEGEHGFCIKKVRVDIKMTELIRGKVKLLDIDEEDEEDKAEESESEPEPELSLEERMKCFLCFEDFTGKGVKALLTHYSKDHYRLELEHNFITRSGKTWSHDRKCQECFIPVQSREEYILHIGVEHRMVDRELPSKYRLPADTIVKERVKEPGFKCPVEDCESEKETKKALLIHLLMIHFNKDMEVEYKDTFKQMKPKKCPKCGMALLDSYLGFIKHLAVDHELVMNYVNTNSDNAFVNEANNSDKHKVETQTIETANNENASTSKPTEEEAKVPAGTSLVKFLPVNESPSRSESVTPQEPVQDPSTPQEPVEESTNPSMPEFTTPPPETEESITPAEPEFDIRAILDSDSDLDA